MICSNCGLEVQDLYAVTATGVTTHMFKALEKFYPKCTGLTVTDDYKERGMVIISFDISEYGILVLTEFLQKEWKIVGNGAPVKFQPLPVFTL